MVLCCVGKVTEVGVYHGLTVKYNNSFSKKSQNKKTERNKSIVGSQLVVQPVVFVSKKHFSIIYISFFRGCYASPLSPTTTLSASSFEQVLRR